MAKWDELTEEEKLMVEDPRAWAEQLFTTGEYLSCWGYDFDNQVAYYINEDGTRAITFKEAHEPPDDEQKGLVRFIAERGQFYVDVPDDDCNSEIDELRGKDA